jgi:hypothetical protein
VKVGNTFAAVVEEEVVAVAVVEEEGPVFVQFEEETQKLLEVVLHELVLGL